MRSTRKRVGQAGVVAVLVAGLVASTEGPAWAGIATSQHGLYTISGRVFHNYAKIETYPSNNSQADASTFTGPENWSAPPGWVGSRGRLFKSTGALSCEGTTQYNSSTLAAKTYVYGFSCFRFQGGTWYSYGVSAGWSGTAYQSFYTFRSPNQNS